MERGQKKTRYRLFAFIYSATDIHRGPIKRWLPCSRKRDIKKYLTNIGRSSGDRSIFIQIEGNGDGKKFYKFSIYFSSSTNKYSSGHVPAPSETRLDARLTPA